MISRALCAVLAGIGPGLAGAWLVQLAAPPAFAGPEADPRLRVVEYRSTLVLPLTAFVGYHVHFEFAPGEFFTSLGAGDTSSLDVGAEGNHLLLKPKQPSAGTNITILTNRRAYFVDYRALARAPRPEEAVYSVVFHYPPADDPGYPSPREHGDDPLATPRPSRNANYWYCGSPALRPLRALDDGLQLRLTFAPRAELPAVYAAEPDGTETLVNTHVEDDTVVVHRLADRFVVRRGSQVGCVVDRSNGGAASRAATGTVDERIVRQTRGVAP